MQTTTSARLESKRSQRPRAVTVFAAAFIAGAAAAVVVNRALDLHLEQSKPQVETETIFVALRSLPQGSRVTVWDVGLRPWPKAMLPATALRASDSFSGLVLKHPLREGQPLLSIQLTPAADTANTAAPGGPAAETSSARPTTTADADLWAAAEPVAPAKPAPSIPSVPAVPPAIEPPAIPIPPPAPLVSEPVAVTTPPATTVAASPVAIAPVQSGSAPFSAPTGPAPVAEPAAIVAAAPAPQASAEPPATVATPDEPAAETVTTAPAPARESAVVAPPVTAGETSSVLIDAPVVATVRPAAPQPDDVVEPAAPTPTTTAATAEPVVPGTATTPAPIPTTGAAPVPASVSDVTAQGTTPAEAREPQPVTAALQPSPIPPHPATASTATAQPKPKPPARLAGGRYLVVPESIASRADTSFAAPTPPPVAPQSPPAAPQAADASAVSPLPEATPRPAAQQPQPLKQPPQVSRSPRPTPRPAAPAPAAPAQPQDRGRQPAGGGSRQPRQGSAPPVKVPLAVEGQTRFGTMFPNLSASISAVEEELENIRREREAASARPATGATRQR